MKRLRLMSLLLLTVLTNFSPSALAQATLPKAQEADTIPQLISRLKDRAPDVRSKAASALGERDKQAKAAVPALLRALRDSNSEVRFFSAWALGHIASDPDRVVPALIRAMKDKDRDVRSQATHSLTVFPTWGKRIVSRLMLGAQSDNADDRFHCLQALADFEQQALPAVPMLLKTLEDPDFATRSVAMRALLSIKPRTLPAAQAMIKAMEKGETLYSEWAALALGDTGITNPEVMNALSKAFISQNPTVTVYAAIAFSKLADTLLHAMLPSKNDPRKQLREQLSAAEKILRDRYYYLGDPKQYTEPALKRISAVQAELGK